MNCYCLCCFFFFQAEDGIRDLVRSRGLGDVYKRQRYGRVGNKYEIVDEKVDYEYSAADQTLFPRMGDYSQGLSLIHI